MTLFVTGDIMLGRGVKRALSQDNFSNLFEPIKKIIVVVCDKKKILKEILN